ncbi:MAG: lytic transglycosylase domain-containing protein [Desulfobaccales bacterium]
MPSTLGPTEKGQNLAAVDEDQEESSAGELNAKHLEDLYAKSGIKDRDRSIEEELKKWEHQSSFDFPIQMNKQVKAYVVYFSTEKKGFTRRSLARSSRYLPMIKEVFREYGLPEDLAYLAMVESGFNPQANSPAGACGMWQFIKGTGLRYGLVINGNVDERQDPEKSTRAAAQYLLDLYKQFGSWYLAAASYNCGEGRVQKELTKSNYKNFWELSANKCIPGETRNYVPQMIAATIIARNPQKFGFGNVPYQSPLTPHTSSNLGLAQAESPAETLIPARSAKTVMPARSAKVAKFHPLPSEDPQPHTVVLAKQKSSVPAKASNKKANRRVCAVEKKTHDKRATKARPEPVVASLFGAPRGHAVKAQASKKRAPASGGSKAGLTRKKTKSSPALLAQKPKPKPSQLAKKKGSLKPKLSKSKSKSKALLVSQAR